MQTWKEDSFHFIQGGIVNSLLMEKNYEMKSSLEI